MIKIIKTKNKLIFFSSIIIALAPILSIYKIGSFPLTIADFCFVILIFISLLFSKVKKTKHFGFIIYFMVFFVISLISIVMRGQNDIIDFIQKWLRIVTMYYIIEIFPDNEINIQIFQKTSLVAGTCVTILLIIQVIAKDLFSIPIFPYLELKILPLNYGTTTSTHLKMSQLIAFTSNNWRPSSIFLEPSHYAQFILLPFTISLFSKNKIISHKQQIFLCVFFTIGIMISGSANGILISAFIWVIWYLNKTNKKMNLQKIGIGLLFIIISILLLTSTDFFSKAWGRVETLNVNGGASTGNLRLLQGLAVYENLSFPEKIFGIGFGNINAYLIENKITTSYLTELGNEYMNGFSTVLVSGGIIGFLLFLMIWCQMFINNKDMVSRVSFLIISILWCTSSMFYSVTTVMYLAFINCVKNTVKYEKHNSHYINYS